MRVIAVLGKGISLEGQVCSKVDFSGNEGSRRLGFTKDKREKMSWKILQVGVSNHGDYIIPVMSTSHRNHHFCPINP